MNTSFEQTTFTAPQQRLQHFEQAVLEHIPVDKEVSILEIGCGTGKQLITIAQALPKAKCTGSDISELNIHEARENLAGANGHDRCQFETADYSTTTYAPVDAILAESVMHLVDAPTEQLFEKVYHELRPGGLFIFTMPYSCPYNHFLWSVRRIFRSLRCRALDNFVLFAAKAAHGKDYDESILKERVEYMYLLPHCIYSKVLHSHLLDRLKFQIIETISVPHASIAQPKHKLFILKK